MSALPPYLRGAKAMAVCSVVLTLLAAGCGPKAPPPAATAKPAATVAKTNAPVAVPVASTDEYVSVFEDILPPRGKDPFFPNSTRRNPVAAASPTEPGVAVHVDPVLVLKAIIHTKKHSQAVINNEILEAGEEGSVRVPNGKVRVKCIEIGRDYVTVQVEGESEPKRLMMVEKNK